MHLSKGKLSDGGKESDIWWHLLSWYRGRKKFSLSHFYIKNFFLSFSSKAGGRKLLAPGASFLTLALLLCYELRGKMFSNLFSSFLFSSFAHIAIEKCYHLRRLWAISRDFSAKTSFCWVSTSTSQDLLIHGLTRFVALKKEKTKEWFLVRPRSHSNTASDATSRLWWCCGKISSSYIYFYYHCSINPNPEYKQFCRKT